MSDGRQRDLVISAATGYGPAVLRPFLASLAEHAPEAQVALVVDDLGDDARRVMLATNRNVRFVNLPDAAQRRRAWSKFGRKVWKASKKRLWLQRLWAHWLKRRPRASTTALLHICLVRHFFARDLLRDSLRDAGNVLLADCRDVFFQADPFARLHGESLVTGVEDPVIRDCRYNSGWITDFYGPEGMARLGDRRIACAGVTLGSRSRVLGYLDCMCDEILRKICVTAYHDGGDQGIHNRLMHDGLLEDVTLAENRGAWIATLHHTPLADYRFDESQGLLTTDGEPVAIVHQYDRKPELVRWVQARWG